VGSQLLGDVRFVALIRGINVGGKKKLPMADLRASMASLGYTDVATYIQSGNVVFTSPSDDSTAAARAIEQKIEQDTNLDVSVIVLSRDQLAAVVHHNPFPDSAVRPTELHVSFLSASPDKQLLAGIDPHQFEPDEYRLGEQVMYMRCPDGLGRSKLAAYPWERRLGVRATSRNWNTITKLLSLLDAT
jgi:uncharacterized protein (DUF1697 family)